jgi:hypothetical protein
MILSGSWRSTKKGSVYTAKAALNGRAAVVHILVPPFEGMHLRAYAGGFGKVAIESAAEAAAALRVRYLSA